MGSTRAVGKEGGSCPHALALPPGCLPEEIFDGDEVLFGNHTHANI